MGVMVNVLECYEFPLSKITTDLQRLYEDTEILQYFYCLRHDLDFGRKLPNTERAQKCANIASLSEIKLLRELDRFLSELPKFPMELTIDELGELKIIPGFNSVFEAMPWHGLWPSRLMHQPTMAAKLRLPSVKVAVRYFSKTETGKNIVMIRNAKKSVTAERHGRRIGKE